MEAIIIGGLLVGAVFAALGAWISAQKGRSPVEGVILGFFFGPLGALVAALMPSQSGSRPSPRCRSDDDPVPTPVAVKIPPRAGSRLRKPLGEEWMPEFPEE